MQANGTQPPTRSPKRSATRSTQRGHHVVNVSSLPNPPSLSNHRGIEPFRGGMPTGAHRSRRRPAGSVRSCSAQSSSSAPGFGCSRAQSSAIRTSVIPRSCKVARSSGQRVRKPLPAVGPRSAVSAWPSVADGREGGSPAEGHDAVLGRSTVGQMNGVRVQSSDASRLDECGMPVRLTTSIGPGNPRSSTSPYGSAATPSGRRSSCIVGISTWTPRA